MIAFAMVVVLLCTLLLEFKLLFFNYFSRCDYICYVVYSVPVVVQRVAFCWTCQIDVC